MGTVYVMYVMYMSCMSCSWLATDRAPPAFVRFSVSLLFLTRSCSVDGVGWGGWGGVSGSCAECVEHVLA